MADAAQEFLDKQLSKNRFTAKQQARLDASGGSAVVDASDGVVPVGKAYAKYGKMPGTESTTPSVGGGTKPSTSSNGIRGSRTADELRKEFGLIYDPNNTVAFDPSKTSKGRMQSDDGHMWYKDSAGQTQYLGQVAGGYERGSIGDDKPTSEAKRKGSDKSMFHADSDKKKMSGNHHQSSNDILQQAHDDRNGPGHDNGFNSINDVAEAFRHMLNTEAPKAEPEKERTPIEHSPEVKQATERVRAYEDNIMSGKTSKDLFGDYYGDTGLDLGNQASDGQEAATNRGDTGVGTNGGADYSTDKATYSFLDAKKSAVKKDKNIQPKEYSWSAEHGQNAN